MHHKSELRHLRMGPMGRRLLCVAAAVLATACGGADVDQSGAGGRAVASGAEPLYQCDPYAQDAKLEELIPMIARGRQITEAEVRQELRMTPNKCKRKCLSKAFERYPDACQVTAVGPGCRVDCDDPVDEQTRSEVQQAIDACTDKPADMTFSYGCSSQCVLDDGGHKVRLYWKQFLSSRCRSGSQWGTIQPEEQRCRVMGSSCGGDSSCCSGSCGLLYQGQGYYGAKYSEECVGQYRNRPMDAAWRAVPDDY